MKSAIRLTLGAIIAGVAVSTTALAQEREPMSAAQLEQCAQQVQACLLYTSPSPRDLSTSRMPSSA